MAKIDIHKVFSPKQALRKTNQDIFTGRKDNIYKAIEEILVPGSSLVIYGERGMGKTSLGWQLLEILSGDYRLLKKNKLNLTSEITKHNCLWISCSEKMKNLDGLLLELMRKFDYSKSGKDEFGNRNFYSLSPDIFTREIESKIETTYKFNFGLVAVDTKKSDAGNSANKEIDFYATSQLIFNTFQELLHKVEIKYPKNELIIFIDEFDRLPDRKGVGELLKLISNARFVLIGVADSIDEIVEDHQSAERKLLNSTIKISGFNRQEVSDFYHKAEALFLGKVKFTEDFINHAYEYCDGFPYLLQYVGFNSLRNKIQNIDQEEYILDHNDFIEGFKSIIDQNGDSSRFQKINNAINGVPAKQEILFKLAFLNKKWISSKEITEIISPDSVKNLNNNLRYLTDSGILKKRERDYRYIDPIIKAMIKFRAEKNFSFL